MGGEIPDEEEDEFREWVIERVGADVGILGPGQLEIRLRRFDARKVQKLEGTAEELGLEEEEGLFSKKIFRIWGYPLSGDTVLRLCSISDAARPSQRAGHYLDLIQAAEWTIQWHPVPDYFAEALHELGAEASSPAPEGERSEEQSLEKLA